MILPEDPQLGLPAPPLGAQFSPEALAELFSPEQPAMPVSEEPSVEQLPPPEPTKKELKKITKFVASCCKGARDFNKKKARDRLLLEALYKNMIGLPEWERWYTPEYETVTNLESLRKRVQNREDGDRSDYIDSPAHLVDSVVDNGLPQIFENPDWLHVIPENPQGPTVEDKQYSTSYKLQSLMLEKLDQGGIHSRMDDGLREWALYGSVYAKIAWHSKTIPSYFMDLETLQRVETEEIVHDCPIVSPIPLDKVLVDWKAKTNNLQLWRFIGHFAYRTYDDIIAGFDKGMYTLNKEEFKTKWKDNQGDLTGVTEEELDYDPDADQVDEDTTTWLTVWEWHGYVPAVEKECVVTMVSNSADDPTNGLVIRCLLAPVLDIGLRPFVSAHFTNQPGPFGIGQIERNKDLLFQISQFVAQFQDNTRRTANATYFFDPSSEAASDIKSNGNRLPSGLCIAAEPGQEDPIRPMQLALFNAEAVNVMIGYLDAKIDRRTSVKDIYEGLSQGPKKTAHQAQIQQQQGAAPMQKRLFLFAKSFLEPMGRIVLGFMQQFLLDDQTVWLQGEQGQHVPLTLTAEEIQSGRYKVRSAITRPDQLAVSKLQNLTQLLPQMIEWQPILAAEGKKMMFSHVMRRILELSGQDRIDQTIVPLTEQEIIQQQMAAQQQAVMEQEAAMNQQAKPSGNGNRPKKQPGQKGGPLGPEPTDFNQVLLDLQMAANPQGPNNGGMPY